MAARILVHESVEKPYAYYRDNVAKSLELFDELVGLGKPRVLFASSASVYAAEGQLRGRRGRPTGPGVAVRADEADHGADPAGHGERHRLRAIILRYFNPIGSDPELESGHLRQASPRTCWASS